MEFKDYLKVVENERQKFPRWREGQLYFNVLFNLNPRLANKVRGTEYDPFYKSDKINKFLDYIKENWR